MKYLFVFSVLLYFAFCEADLKLFHQFIDKYEKSYTKEEFYIRYYNFQASLERVNLKNKHSKGVTYGITKFSDLSTEEFQNIILMKNPIIPTSKPRPTSQVIQPKINSKDLPTFFDWRDKGAVTPVKDQGQCGSCWAFSATENIESMWILAGKSNNNISLSPQQIVDCDYWVFGCDGGQTTSAFNYVIGAPGLESDQSYPYTAQGGSCRFDKSKVVSTISTWNYANSWYEEAPLQTNLVSWGPLSVCVDASNWQDYQSGVMTWEDCAYINKLDHCVQLVGYNTQNSTNPYWIVRNSWGTDWGISGYIWLQMWEDTCGIAHEATCAVI